jgi:magnesium chelatase subunit D
VGQDALKTALLLNAVDPRVGGVLIRGEKGTAKSTAVRALASVLPETDFIEGCRYGCDPTDPGYWCDDCRARRESGPLGRVKRRPRVVELPVSATEDRLIGTLDLERALKSGESHFQPGLLADANRSILYVDEVNLLDDHLVDTLLDAAAMGVNTVEREGISFRHPARFILVGTMNPEEGELRPQLLDRFGLCVDIEGVREPEARVEIVRRRRAFEEDPTDFAKTWKDAEDALETTLKHARLRLPTVVLADELLYAIAAISLKAGVDGHRADHVMARAAAALAAFEGRSETTIEDVARVAPMVLAHRMRRGPFDDGRADEQSLRSMINRALTGEDDGEGGESSSTGPGEGQTTIFEAAATAVSADAAASAKASLEAQLDRTRRSIGGRRQESVSDSGRGRYTRSESSNGVTTASDFALDATIRAAAPFQVLRDNPEGLALKIEPADVKKKVRTRKVGATIVFCVDASGSMGASKRMEAAKAAVLDLLVDAYQRRDRVSLVSFRGERADIVLSPTASVELANLRLKGLPTGGATPLAAGILKSIEVAEGELRRSNEVVPWIVLVTDGRGNVGLDGGLGSEDARIAATRLKMVPDLNVVVIDTAGGTGGSAAKDLARVAGAEHVRLATLDGAAISSEVKKRIRDPRLK